MIGGALIFVSHDRYFIRRFADRVWEVDGGFTDYAWDYEGYRRVKARNAITQRAVPAPSKPEAPRKQESTEKRGRNAKAERKMTVVEHEIADKEAMLAGFDARMEAVASDYVALQQLTEEKAALEHEIEQLYAEWERLSTL